MAKTQLADIIVPAQFAAYVLQRTAEKSDLFQSGIVEANPDYDTRAALGGTQVNMPHWNDLTGLRQPLSDSSPLVTVKIAVFAPMPRASVKMVAAVNPGLLPSTRMPKRRLRRRACMVKEL